MEGGEEGQIRILGRGQVRKYEGTLGMTGKLQVQYKFGILDIGIYWKHS